MTYPVLVMLSCIDGDETLTSYPPSTLPSSTSIHPSQNYYVPPVIFALSVNEDGDERRVTIDGKQRCTSIMRFMDGEIPFKSPNGEKFWYRAGAGRGKPLPRNLKDRFDLICLVVVEYDGISDQVQRDIFRKLHHLSGHLFLLWHGSEV